MSNDNSISLNKYISDTGYCSRREADRLIERGRISINGKVATKGNRVFAGDEVSIDGELTQSNPKPIYIAYYKPIGIVTTTDQRENQNIIAAIGHEKRLFPIGRLDKDSEGLIFLTNDGHIVNRILRAENKHEKEYIVSVRRRITSKFIDHMRNGVNILGTRTKPCQVKRINDRTFNIVLTQGLNRQIRRMCTALDNEVSQLQRVRIMNVQLGKLKPGRWRNLTEAELLVIKKLTADSRENTSRMKSDTSTSTKQRRSKKGKGSTTRGGTPTEKRTPIRGAKRSKTQGRKAGRSKRK